MSSILSPELEKYYTDRWDMMATQGWKDLVEDVQNMYDSVNDLSNISTQDHLMKSKGEIEILQWILSLKDVSEQVYKELQIEDSV